MDNITRRIMVTAFSINNNFTMGIMALYLNNNFTMGIMAAMARLYLHYYNNYNDSHHA